MNEDNQNLPDDFWRKAFDEAAETPPARVWDAVERRLDESQGPRILPLWGTGLASSRPVMWGAGLAAALALLLVGWWVIRTGVPDDSVARTEPATRPGRVVVAPKVPSPAVTNPTVADERRPVSPAPVDAEAVASIDKPVTKPANETDSEVAVIEQPMAAQNRSVDSPVARTEPKLTLKHTEAAVLSDTTLSAVAPARAFVPDDLTSVKQPTVSIAAETSVRSISNGYSPEPTTQLAVTKLTSRPLRLREPAPIQRIVWVAPAELTTGVTAPTVAQSNRESKKFWASASLMPGAFTPSVMVRSAPLPVVASNVSAQNVGTVSQPSVDSRADLSVAYQAGAGVQLTDRWSIESGVGYLVGRSTVYSPTLASAAIKQANVAVQTESTADNLYADALRNSVGTVNTPSRNQAFSNTNALADYSFLRLLGSNYSNQTRQTLSNDYRYVQVPVQIGYQLRPRKRLSLALLGGLLTNIFVRNSVGDDLVVTSRDGVYRPLSWAATMGARFRYRPSRRWSASLVGIYQPSLGLGTRPSSDVTSRPTSTGVSFGVDYHF